MMKERFVSLGDGRKKRPIFMTGFPPFFLTWIMTCSKEAGEV